MKTIEDIKSEIIRLLPKLDTEAHGAGNAAYSSFTHVRGQVKSLLWVLEMDTSLADKHTAKDDINKILNV